MNITSIWNSVYPIVIAILFFELIIVIHELGHFAVAKLMKIQVNEFSIGMGPKLFQHKGKKTKYSLTRCGIGVKLMPLLHSREVFLIENPSAYFIVKEVQD